MLPHVTSPCWPCKLGSVHRTLGVQAFRERTSSACTLCICLLCLPSCALCASAALSSFLPTVQELPLDCQTWRQGSSQLKWILWLEEQNKPVRCCCSYQLAFGGYSNTPTRTQPDRQQLRWYCRSQSPACEVLGCLTGCSLADEVGWEAVKVRADIPAWVGLILDCSCRLGGACKVHQSQ